ncbi:hypothetical protein O7627_06825 [Solwaraspora sp. WMMD1047]|uniref:hypothetical protein n=1 Tax=Solwaraspora sp. WMMD1047 TaxID=3016102 RepID=UPI002416DDB2|nr:hypothetical protein [Solwaraspora sp. WMMD1047]MDG4829020.1 hypothetical protein [Solwaraspora sp. WMMD1047]
MAQFPATGEPGSLEPGAGGAGHRLPPDLAGDREPELPEPVTAPALAGSASGYRVGSYPVPGPYPPAGPAGHPGSYGPYDPDEELAGRTRRPVLRLLAIAIPVFLIVTVGVVALLSDQRGGQDPTGTAILGDRGEQPAFVVPPDPRTATAPMDGREESSFDLITGTNAVTLRVVDLGPELYRITTPPGGNTLPRPSVQGDRVRLQLVPSGEDGPGSVEIELNSQVRWEIRMTGGAAEQLLDLGEARLSGVELLGGTTRTELTLPEPDGTLAVRMTGGINQFVINAPAGPPVRVRAGKGAASVTLDDDRRSGVAPGAVFTQPDWENATDRYDIDMVVGVATLTVQRG